MTNQSALGQEELANIRSELARLSTMALEEFEQAWVFVKGRQTLPEALAWAKVGQLLCRQSEELATAYFQAGPRLLQSMTPDAMEILGAIVLSLSRRSLRVAGEVIERFHRELAELPYAEQHGLLEVGKSIAERNVEATRVFFAQIPSYLAHIRPDLRAGFLSQAQRIVQTAEEYCLPFLTDGSKSLGSLSEERQPQIMGLCGKLADISPRAAIELLKSAPILFDKLESQAIERWWQQGIEVLTESAEGGAAYYALRSREARELLALLSPGVELADVKQVLRLYCQALMGKSIQVLATEELTHKGIGWISAESPTTEGTAIFAPSRLQEFDSQAKNFEAYKVITTHQAAHLEFGTFDFSLHAASTVFVDMRPSLFNILGDGSKGIADFEKFFDLFADRRLARDAFTLAEDFRIDSRLKREYRGIGNPLSRIQHHAATKRPPLAFLPLREAFMEILIQFSLGIRTFTFPTSFLDRLIAAAGILTRAASGNATPEDSAEASIRLYTLARSIPNLPSTVIPLAQWSMADLSSARYPQGDGLAALIDDFLKADTQGPDTTSGKDEEQAYKGTETVDFRGELKPELVQTLMRLRQANSGDIQDGEISQALRGLLEKSADFYEFTGITGEDYDYTPVEVLENLLKERGAGGIWHKEEQTSLANDLGEGDTDSFLYDEWDFRAKSYRQHWSRLWQRTMKEGSTAFFEDTRKAYPALVTEVRRQFELLKPERLGKVKRLHFGEEFDLDSVVEAVVERRAGSIPNEKVYWRRNRVVRDVSLALLLDMSLSTEERIETDTKPRLAGETARNQNKRIIDLEKESLVLMIEALEQIGDTYGIYGFSGYGRERVEFFIVKDIEEPFSERVKRRIDRMAPVLGTRMGPAIRHTITKLEAQESKTRLLLLISDGRPQDRGYGADSAEGRPLSPLQAAEQDSIRREFMRELEEKEYAVHDTRMALLEARQKNVIPFCLSVDKAGHDYLRAMCGDIGYEVVADIESLPRRLPMLYRRLTT